MSSHECTPQSMMQCDGDGTTRDAPEASRARESHLRDCRDVPASVRHGLFATPHLPAYIRFSNGCPIKRCRPMLHLTRGMAIVVCGVDGDKEAPDGPKTHVETSSSPVTWRSFVPDVLSHVDFQAAVARRQDPVCIRNRRSPSARSRARSPSALQPDAARARSAQREACRTIDPRSNRRSALTLEQMAARSPNCLREAMVQHLASKPAIASNFLRGVATGPGRRADRRRTRVWGHDATHAWQPSPCPAAGPRSGPLNDLPRGTIARSAQVSGSSAHRPPGSARTALPTRPSRSRRCGTPPCRPPARTGRRPPI